MAGLLLMNSAPLGLRACRVHLTPARCVARHLAGSALGDRAPRAVPVPTYRHLKQATHQAAGRRHTATKAGEDGKDFDFDLFVIGGGTGGVRAARLSSMYGGKVGLCELPKDWVSSEDRGGLGGTCILRGCVPKKLLHYASSFMEEIEDAEGYGRLSISGSVNVNVNNYARPRWHLTGKPELDWSLMMEREHKELDRLSSTYQKQLESNGVKFIEGRGKITGKNSVEVAGHSYTTKNILIAVGGKPIRVPIEGNEHCIVSDEILHLPSKPSKVGMIGGGYIACEQASIYNNFGAEVHFFIRGDNVLNPAFDMEARNFVGQQYKQAGINMALNTTPTKIEKGSDGKLTVTAEPKDGEPYTVSGFDIVMMATGRAPTTKGLGLEDIGVKMDDKGGVVVDEFSRSVSVPNVFAVGDVTNRLPLTPVARMEGMQLAAHLFRGDKDAKADHSLVPSVVFSSPEVAIVGITEDAAVDQHKNVQIFKSEFTPMKASVSSREVKAFCKVIVASDSDKVVGIHMVCPDASEIMQGWAAAMKAGITKHQMDTTVGLHPTSAEEFVTMYEPTRVYKDGKEQRSSDV